DATVDASTEKEMRFVASLLEATPGVLYFYDQTGRLLRWNRNFETATGYSAAEIARLQPLDFFAEADKQTVARAIAAVFAQGSSSVEAPLLARDGSTTPYFFTGRRVSFDGQPCLIGVGIDISERKRAVDALSKLEQRYRTTLDSTLEGCQLLDFEWRYLYLNGAAAKQNRRPNSELLGRSMGEAWPGIEGSEVFAMLKRCMDTRVAEHSEIEFTFPDGRAGWFDVRVQPVPEGIFVLSIDISERKRAELALRELNDSLEQKVVERTLELKAATERAETADRIKSAFLATMSHELRTPLNSIIGFTGIVLQGLAGALNDEQSKQLGMVQGSARHLLALINDVLDISKIEAGQLGVQCSAFNLQSCIDDVVASVQPLASKKGLTLRATVPPSLRPMVSDKRRVQQILLNLLNNAIKFTDRGTVDLSVTVSEGSGHDGDPAGPVVRIQVTDTGIGMKKEDLSTLFQPFRQIDSGIARLHEGTGLGLAISRRLTSLLGGTIHVDSEVGVGSVFTVVLPNDQRQAGGMGTTS
ncbi:MAG TPA: ATP-binding protein, partial [Polyangia bacterium]|nr:ATP-binding protein [Polyangia bacterium]